MPDSHTSEVQAELQQYLNIKNINGLFIAIVESLLIEKPTNPIAFIIDYLIKTYPDQAKLASGLHGIGSASKNDLLNIEPPSPQQQMASIISTTTITDQISFEEKRQNKVKIEEETIEIPVDKSSESLEKDNESDDDEADGEDKFDENSTLPFISHKSSKSRRSSISGESYDPDQAVDEFENRSHAPSKSPEVQAHLLSIIESSPLLRSLEIDQRISLVDAFSGPVLLSEGTNIIEQGDEGDLFYLLEKGDVAVYKSESESTVETRHPEADDWGLLVHTYHAGASFGELALLYNTPRAATCRTLSDCTVWTLDRHSFKSIVVATAVRKRETHLRFLKLVPVLSSLTEEELMSIADELVEEKFNYNDKICTQGEAGNFFYILKTGSAMCTQYDPETDDEDIVATLSSRDYFGEIALMTSKVRQATVIAQENVSVLCIDHATFTRVLSERSRELLKRNMEEYENIHNLDS